MKLFTLLVGSITLLAFIGCGDGDPVSSQSEEGIAKPAGKLTISATKAGGYRGPFVMKRVYRNLHRAINPPHDLDMYLSHTTDDLVFEQVPAPPPAIGKEEVTAEIEGLLRAFPDLQTDVRRMFTSGSTLIAEYTMSGTQLGEFSGIPATENKVQVIILDVVEFEGDKVKSLRKYFDSITWMVQLGVMPAGELPSLELSFELADPEPTGLSPVQTVKEYMNRWNAHDIAGAARLMKKDAAVYMAPLGIPMDSYMFHAFMEHMLSIYSDLTAEPVRYIDLGDGWVLIELVMKGTNDGPYMPGIPVTGKTIANRVATLYRVDADGIIIEKRSYWDELTALIQLGLAPMP